MKYKLIFILLLIQSTTCLSKDASELMKIASEYKANYYHPHFLDDKGEFKNDLEEVQRLINDVTNEIDSGSNNPIIHWLRPMLKQNLLVMRRTHYRDTFSDIYGTNDTHSAAFKM